MIRPSRIAAIFLYLSLTANTLAAALFGGEFTLTNPHILNAKGNHFVNSKAALAGQKKLLAKFTAGCLPLKKCRVEKLKNSYGLITYKVHFLDDGFWLQISTDPSVIEVQTKPSTFEEFTKAKGHIKDLFEAGAAMGLMPDPNGHGGGHIHMDIASTFKGDAKLFRNFIVDYVNHPELGGYGVFGGDTSNSPHLSQLSEKQQQEFRNIIADFDRGNIKDIKALANAINKNVYKESPAGWKPAEKYQALNLTRATLKDGMSTIEFRALDPQRSPEEFLLQLELFEKRVEYLKALPGPLEIRNFTPMGVLESTEALKTYVKEAGLEWNRYAAIVRNISAEEQAPAAVRPLLQPRQNFFRRTCDLLFSALRPSYR